MHQPYELVGNDGAKFHVWAKSSGEAYKSKWQYKHGGLAEVHILAIRDMNDPKCWDNALRIQVGRQCDAVLVACTKHGAFLDEEGNLRY
jgi:hypothetical protein